MVDINGTRSIKYNLFRGLNLRDDENELPYGQTPDGQNFEILRQTGLRKARGYEARYPDFDTSFNFSRATNFTDKYGVDYHLSVSYPYLIAHLPQNGSARLLSTDLSGTGEPFFFDLTQNQKMLVDGVNNPRIINSDLSVTEVTWPPTYSVQNNSVLDESNLAVAANPTTLGVNIGFPSLGALYENRAWLAGDKLAPNRIYVSKVLDFDAFGDNSGSTFDVAFFVDVPTNSRITGLKVVNNQYMVIYCLSEIHVLTGKFPPASGFPTPHFSIDLLNPFIGALGPRLIVDKGDNDHFYVSNFGTIFTLSNTDNFQDVRPRGISGKIFPAVQNLELETLQRGFLVNYSLQSELYFFFPNLDQRRYSNQAYIFDYGNDAPLEDPQWTRYRKLGDVAIRDCFVDKSKNDLVLVGRNNFYNLNQGLTFGGEPIDMDYQFATLDFGDPDRRKEIVNITIYATSLSNNTTRLLTYHQWEDNTSGYSEQIVQPGANAVFGSAVYDVSRWQSFAGSQFNKIEFQPNNPAGKILKFKIRHFEEADLFIHSVVFRVKDLGR